MKKLERFRPNYGLIFLFIKPGQIFLGRFVVQRKIRKFKIYCALPANLINIDFSSFNLGEYHYYLLEMDKHRQQFHEMRNPSQNSSLWKNTLKQRCMARMKDARGDSLKRAREDGSLASR